MKTYTQLLEELYEAAKLTPHEVLTNIAKKRTTAQNAELAQQKQRLERKTSGRTNLNDPPDVLDAEIIKKEINKINVGAKNTSDASSQGFNTFLQKLKKGKYTDAQVGGTRFDTPEHRGR